MLPDPGNFSVLGILVIKYSALFLVCKNFWARWVAFLGCTKGRCLALPTQCHTRDPGSAVVMARGPGTAHI